MTPHLGNLVGSVLSADVTARYYRLKGADTLMVSGSDTHGTPIEVEAIKEGITQKLNRPQPHKVAELFRRWDAPLTITQAPKAQSIKNSSRKPYWKSSRTATSSSRTRRCSTANMTSASCRPLRRRQMSLLRLRKSPRRPMRPLRQTSRTHDARGTLLRHLQKQTYR